MICDTCGDDLRQGPTALVFGQHPNKVRLCFECGYIAMGVPKTINRIAHVVAMVGGSRATINALCIAISCDVLGSKILAALPPQRQIELDVYLHRTST